MPRNPRSNQPEARQPQAKPAETAGPGPIDVTRISETGQKSLAAFAHLHSRVFRDALTFNAGLLDFAQRRIRKDIETQDRLSRCESVSDAMTVMTDFCQGAYTDYAEQTKAMMRTGAAITSNAAEETIAETARSAGESGEPGEAGT